METKASNIRFAWVARAAAVILGLGLCGGLAVAGDEPENAEGNQRSTAKDFLRLEVRPIAIGHHGVGPYIGENPAVPIENTVDSVRLAYSLGARVVEVDVQLTRDGKLAVFHDDFLSDFTCVHSLTLEQLQARLPFVPELHQVLDIARYFNEAAGDNLGGILIVELKAFSPHCDPADEFEQAVVTAAVNEVRQAKMAKLVIFDSFSPALLYLALQAAPEIPRELDLDGLQLLTPAQVQAATGLPVTIINKKISLGLTWAGVPFAGLRFAGAIPDHGNRQERARGWRRDRFLRAGRAATDRERRSFRGSGALAGHARVRRSGEQRSGLEVLRLAGRGCHLQHDSDGSAVAAGDSGDLISSTPELESHAHGEEAKVEFGGGLLPCSAKGFFPAGCGFCVEAG